MLATKLATSYGALASFLFATARAIPVQADNGDLTASLTQVVWTDDWLSSLSNDTRQRLVLARENVNDESAQGQAFRNDTIMRINIEREALDLSLIDLSQAFGLMLPAPRLDVGGVDVKERNDAEDFREEGYLRDGTMYSASSKRDDSEDFREEMYLRSGSMYWANSKRDDSEDFREEGYLRSGSMYWVNNKRDGRYDSLLDRKNLALGAVERVNIAHRVLGKPGITMNEATEAASHGVGFVNSYWNASVRHGNFWATDQPAGKPNFIEGGQANGFGYTQSTYHKLHCLANLRTVLAWHIMGQGLNVTKDMDVHTIHCLEYIRGRELAYPDLYQEPIDTVDYKGMGIH